jgi:hemerythrin-like domain-containing protein
MSEIVELLKLEHRSIERVLDLLAEQEEKMATGGAWDPTLMRVALAYLSGFPEECHHPKEDLLFRRMQARAPERVAAMADLARSHELLSQATTRVCDEASAQPPLESSDLAKSLAGFIAAYRNHMSAEESEFFPAALDCLSGDDMAVLDFQVFDRCDPLIEPRTEAEFWALQKEIQRIASRPRPVDTPSPERLADVVTPLLGADIGIAQLNAALAPHGLHLTPLEVGYALEWRERCLTEIPACSETRAVWCTFYFLKGMETGW